MQSVKFQKNLKFLIPNPSTNGGKSGQNGGPQSGQNGGQSGQNGGQSVRIVTPEWSEWGRAVKIVVRAVRMIARAVKMVAGVVIMVGQSSQNGG